MRRTAPTASILTIIAATGLALAPAAAGAAQEGEPQAQQAASPEEVRLRREVADLREQLARSQERIRRLEEERSLLLDELRLLRERRSGGSGDAGGGSEPIPGETRQPRAEIPDDPFAAPAAMLQELRERYERQFASVPHDTEAAMEDYRRDVRQWIEQMRRELRSRTTWLVRFTNLREEEGQRRVTAQVIDEESGLPIGNPFDTDIDFSIATKLERGMERFDRWNATVVVAANPRFNPERTDPGVFEHPPFVGRYVDFGINIDWRYVNGERTREEAEREQPGGENQSQTQSEGRDR